MSQKRIAVIEDEEDLRSLVVYTLSREGYEVIEASRGRSGLALITRELPDLVLLDVMLPEMDGFGICKEIKAHAATRHIPVIMITSRGEEDDRLTGFGLGADDYVVKPFSVKELALRVAAVLRRTSSRLERIKEEGEGHVLQRGPFVLSPESHSFAFAGEPIELTATEFRLIEDLLRHEGVVRKREQLLDTVWGYTFDGYARTVDTHVRRLRAKLQDGADYIETIRGVGYRFKDISKSTMREG